MTTKPQLDPLGSSRLMFWQPIETAPKDGSQILAAVRYATKGCYETLLLYWATILEEYPEGVWVFDSYIPVTYGKPTHWMPVPRYMPPKTEP